MNKDFAVWWVKNSKSFFSGLAPHDFEDLEGFAKNIAEEAWDAAIEAENLKRQQNGGPG